MGITVGSSAELTGPSLDAKVFQSEYQ